MADNQFDWDGRQSTHHLQRLSDLLDRVHMFNVPEDRQRLITEFLTSLPDADSPADDRSTWLRVAQDANETSIEEVLGTLLSNGDKGCYDSEQVRCLLTTARVRFPLLYERERFKAVTRGWNGRDFDRMVDAYADYAMTTDAAGNPWSKAIPVAQFLQQTDETWMTYARDMVFQGGTTFVAAPRGTGKSVVSLMLGCALATGGVFRGESVQLARVLLVDRDNPPRLVRERFRNMGANAIESFRILTREDAPSLRDRIAWQAFPVEQYDVVILDSWSAFTEGVSEKEGRLTQLCLATLKDLANCGPAILVLDNTNKGATSYRGRSEKADAADILYEVRDITGWTPSTSDWWMELPEAGDHAWQSRAMRRKEQAVLRVAFVASKFRLGIEPKPFALEVNMCSVPWTLRDITEDLEEFGKETARQETAAQRRQLEAAAQMLRREIQQRPHDVPLLKKEAEQLLRDMGLSVRQARHLLEDGFNAARHPKVGWWILRPIPNRAGNPIGVYLVDEEVGVPNSESSSSPYTPRERSKPISDSGSKSGVPNTPGTISRNSTNSGESYLER
jgi:hypothetical protein